MRHNPNINSQGLLVPEWPAPKNVRAFCTTRVSFQTASQHPALTDYAAFNLALHVGDNANEVKKHRIQLSTYLNLNDRDIAWLEQVHGTDIVPAESACRTNLDSPLQADASITSETGKACTVMTADCLPVLFCNLSGSDEKQLVAAAHAGWRGLASGILSKTLARFPSADQVIAWLGPAISQKHFEVGDEVYRAFIEKNPQNRSAFIPASTEAQQSHPGSQTKWLASLTRLARIELEQAGIRAIYGGEHCTFKEQELFYSYRRDGSASGRMASLIFIE